MAQHDVADVGVRLLDRGSSRLADRHRDRLGREHLRHRAEQGRQALEVVDPGLGERPDAGRVVPGRPGRAGVAVETARGVDAHRSRRGEPASRGRGTSARAGRTAPRGRGGRARAASAASCSASSRLMASGFSTTTCLPCSSASRAELGVARRRRQDDDDVDIGRRRLPPASSTSCAPGRRRSTSGQVSRRRAQIGPSRASPRGTRRSSTCRYAQRTLPAPMKPTPWGRSDTAEPAVEPEAVEVDARLADLASGAGQPAHAVELADPRPT